MIILSKAIVFLVYIFVVASVIFYGIEITEGYVRLLRI